MDNKLKLAEKALSFVYSNENAELGEISYEALECLIDYLKVLEQRVKALEELKKTNKN